MKKTVAIFTTALMLAGATALVGCNKEEAQAQMKVMNVSCNPSVEFVLNDEDKVISVNALNEEGNLVLTAETFVGKDAEEAAKLFVQVSNETGFIVSGNAQYGNNEVSISFSGDAKQAEALYNEVKAKVNEYLSEENITATIKQAQAITEEQLEQLVAECAPYMEMAEIQALEYMELVETIYASRKETVDFYSQELKNAYYEAKAFAMQQAELETLKSKLPTLAQAALSAAQSAYESAVNSIEQTRKDQLVSETSAYQKALNNFRQAKVEYLKYREEVAAMEQNAITEAILSVLNSYESAVNAAEQALVAAGEAANAALDSIKATVDSTYQSVVSIIETASVQASEYLDEISANQKAAQEQFFADFEAGYASAITAAETGWKDMKAQLEANTQPAPQE